MQFQVPQFIEVEDKIFGPLTFKQFVYIGGALGASYLAFRGLPLFLAAPLILAFCGLGGALAFMQLNGRPFILTLENSFFFVIHPKLYLWSNVRKKKSSKEIEKIAAKAATTYIPNLTDSKLHELSWSLDIQERIAGGTLTPEERDARHPSHDALAPIRTANEARATKGESIAQQIEKLARERPKQSAVAAT